MIGAGSLIRSVMQDSSTGDSRTPSVFAKVALMAATIAVVVTVWGWFVAGKGSPINHGVAPDVHDWPLLAVWVVANAPAAIREHNEGLHAALGFALLFFLAPRPSTPELLR
jgi:hypothetical protein